MVYGVRMTSFDYLGKNIGYTVEGEGSPILAFHGTTQAANAWDQVKASCSEPRTWVVCEFPGSGDSSMPTGPIDLDEVVDGAVELMKSLGHNTFHVVGYSLGAVAALKTAARHPSQVSTVTSLCGWSQSDARMRITFDLWRRLIAIDPALFMRYAVADGYSVPTIEMLEPMIDTVASMGAITVQPGSDAHLELDLRVDIEADLDNVTCPSLILGGRDDRWVDFSKSQHLASRIAGARLVELPAGHLVIGELPGDIAREIISHTS